MIMKHLFSNDLVAFIIIIFITIWAFGQALPTRTYTDDDATPIPSKVDRWYWELEDGEYVGFNKVADRDRIAIRKCYLNPDAPSKKFEIVCYEWVVLDARAWQWLKYKVNNSMDRRWR